MEHASRIYVAGHTGLVGSAIVRELKKQNFRHIITADQSELDLRNQSAVDRFFKEVRPEYLFLAAAKVGGIIANNAFPAEFIYDNIMIASNIIQSAYIHKATKLLFLGSSCIYPKLAPQPIPESALLTGPLEPTNAPYAIAKIAGITMAQAYARQYGCRFISAMPTNLYGPYDTFSTTNGHVIPALIAKLVDAQNTNAASVIIGGTGEPLREFLHADDCAQALIHLMLHYEKPDIINIGSNEEISIKALAEMIAQEVGFTGKLHYDTAIPNGTMRKKLDTRCINNLGWHPQVALRDGIKQTLSWYYTHYEKLSPKTLHSQWPSAT